MDEPNAEQAAKNLLQLGAKAIVFMPIGFATENHETLLDVHHIIHALAKQYSDVAYIQMPCVNDHPQFSAMVAEWANEYIAELMQLDGTAVNSQLGAVHHHHHHH